MAGNAAYFVSDAHFGLNPDERVKVRLFAELAAKMRADAADVFLVGDMFDFWVEYGSVIRRDYFLILHELRGLVEAGVRVHYVCGNHDFAIGTFLEETVGVQVHRGGVDMEFSGRKAHICHGDKVCNNSLTQIAYALLRNRRLQAIYKLIHPDIGVMLGKTFSAVSKSLYGGRELPPRVANKYRRAAAARMRAGECDLVVMAHTHHADLVNFGGGDYCNTGSWANDYTYAVLRDGKIELLKWDIDNP